MKNRDYRESKRKHELIDQLMKEKRAGKKKVYRKLKVDDITKVEKIFIVKPSRIIIYTKRFQNPYYIKNNLLKSIHFNYVKGKKTLVKNYHNNICKLLDDFEISYDIEYEISLI